MIAIKPTLAGAILFLIFCALAYGMRQRDIEFIIEPDFAWQAVESWRQFFSTLDPSTLPRPKPHVYLDGQFIIYGLADAAIRWFTGAADTPGDTSFALGSALLVNGVAYAAAGALFFASVFRISGNTTIAAVMAVSFFLSPQMFGGIHLARVDYLNMLPVSVIFYCSCLLVLGEAGRRHAVALGGALALAATIKINGLFLGVIPACAAFATFEPKKVWRLVEFTALSILTFLLTYFVLMGRFFYHLTLAEIAQFYVDSIEMIRPWAEMVSDLSRFYYNFEIFKSHGAAFIALYLACAAITIAHAIAFRSRLSVFLSLCFLVFSVAGIFSMKHVRGGYHFLPVLFATIGLVCSLTAKSMLPRLAKAAILLIAAASLSVSFARSITVYNEVASKRLLEANALKILKHKPREWLVSNLPPNTSICIQTHSHWTLPSLHGFAVTDGPLALPYLQPAQLAAAAPPNMETVVKLCEAIVTSDLHRRMFDGYMVNASPENAAKWRQLFADLHKAFPPVIFTSPVAVYAKEIEIYNLRPR